MTATPDTPEGAVDVAVIVVAAGSGTRLGQARPKALVGLSGDAGSRAIVQHCLDAVFSLADPVQVIVVAPAAQLDEMAGLCRDSAGAASGYLTVVAGGATRQESVSRGLAVVRDGIATVLVHDAARAFTPVDQFERVIAAVAERQAGVVPALPVVDTIKQTDDAGRVLGTVDRSTLAAVQTPQGFPASALRAAYASATDDHTDDAAVFSAAGGAVTTVAGDVLAFKITTPWDLRRAEQLVRDRAGEPSDSGIRTGVGIDVHAFDAESPLWLGGLHWPGEAGLAGHSDGDALSHAICDALLSAAGLGDIGGSFGTADARLAGAHGDVFLTETIALLRGAGFAVVNVAAQVVARRPKLSPRRVEMQERLSELVGAPVSVSATTTDGLGFTGRTEGVAVVATALVRRVG